MVVLSKRKQKELIADGYDLKLLKTIQPQGNINFKPDRFYYGGDGYYTVLHVYEYPTEGLENFWLLDLMQVPGTRAFLSVYHEDNKMIKSKLTKSIEEKETRITGNAKHTANQEEVDEIQDMTQLFRQIRKSNIAMLGVYIRIFVTAPTEVELFKRVEEIKEKTSQFKMTILTGELDYEYQAPWVAPSEQIKLPNKRRATVMRAFDLAGGYFFNHTKLEDPRGSYFGYTPTNGAVNFDFLHRDSRRTRSMMMISGNPRMGEKTFSLKLNDDLYAKGNYIRNFDASRTFTQQTRQQHGLILDLSGNANRINPFQVFPTATNEDGITVNEISSFDLHIEKLLNIFKMMNERANGDDMNVLKNVLSDFYISKKMWFRNPNNHLAELRATQVAKEECPVLSDFVNFLYDNERRLSMKSSPNSFVLASLTRIRQTFESMLQNKAGIFEGTTQFQDISHERVVTFDFSSLKDQPDIFNAQIFSVLSLVSADVTNNGKLVQRRLQANPALNESDCPHYIVNIGDAQKLINPKYARSVDLLADIMDGMGGNYAGVILSVNSLQGIIFEDSAAAMNDPYILAVKRIFGLMQYRVFAQTSETDVPLLANALKGSMNPSELETLPKLSKGQLFMNIAGVGNTVFMQQLMPNEQARYGEA